MNWNQFFTVIIQLAVFTVFVTSIIEVIKGISATGFWQLLKDIIPSLTKNKTMASEGFPTLNFLISFICCWTFNVGVMHIFASSLGSNDLSLPFSKWLDYFGTSSTIYLGADQLFKKFLAVRKDAEELVGGSKNNNEG